MREVGRLIAAVREVPRELARGACVTGDYPAEWWDTSVGDLILDLTEEGLTRREIAQHTGRTVYHVWRVQRDHNLTDDRRPGGDDELRGVRVCWEECPVRRECLEYAVRSGESTGIWGGLTPGGRAKLARLYR